MKCLALICQFGNSRESTMDVCQRSCVVIQQDLKYAISVVKAEREVITTEDENILRVPDCQYGGQRRWATTVKAGSLKSSVQVERCWRDGW